MLEVNNITAGYHKTAILTGVSAHVGSGELIGLVGPNGAGKSLLLKTIAGLIAPLSGGVQLENTPTVAFPPKDRAKTIAWLAQDRHAAWALSVRELVCLGRAPYRGKLGRLSREGEQAVDAAMAETQCLDLQHRQFDQLSGGEQARVLLARALAVNAPLLLADEPTASLDPYYQLSIMQALKAQTQAGKTAIASLHDLALAKQFCDRIWVLHDGHLLADDTPQNALRRDIIAQAFHVEFCATGQIKALA